MNEGKARQWLVDQCKEYGRGAQERLAEHMSLPPKTVSQMVTGGRKITADELIIMSDFFGHSPVAKRILIGNVHVVAWVLGDKMGQDPKEFAEVFVGLCEYLEENPANKESVASIVDFQMALQKKRG